MSDQPTRRPLDPDRVERARARLPRSSTVPALRRLQRALCDDARLRIVAALRAGPLAVDDIALVIGRESPATSQHLRVLREIGVVEGERRASRIYYRLGDSPTAEQAARLLDELEQGAQAVGSGRVK